MWNQKSKHNQLISRMENLLKAVEKASFFDIQINAEKLKFFTTKVKIWDYLNVRLNNNQKLSVEDCSLILSKIIFWNVQQLFFNIKYTFFILLSDLFCSLSMFSFLKVWCLLSQFFCCRILQFCNFLQSVIVSSPSSMLRNANLISVTKNIADNDKNVSTKILAARFEQNVRGTEVSGENIWQNFGYLSNPKSNCNMEKVN